MATITLEAPRELKMRAPLIELCPVERVYRTGKLEYRALRGVELKSTRGEIFAIVLVVAISMVRLINAITMSVLERTREIGVLRCIGARARDIRRIFAAKGSLSRWAVGCSGYRSAMRSHACSSGSC